MDSTLPLQIRRFNERVRAMNQANSKILTLNAEEARNLHAEIYDLLARLTDTVKEDTSNNSVINVRMDGGRF